MRALLWLIGLFALAVGLAALARFNEGIVLITLPPWQIDLSFNFFILLLLGGGAAIYFLMRLAKSFYTFPGSWSQWRVHRRRDKAGRALREELLSFFEGHYSKALKHASVAYIDREDAPTAALLAAYAAHELDDGKRFHAWMDKVVRQGKSYEPARLMLATDLALRDGRILDAQAFFDKLKSTGQEHIAIHRLGLRVARVGRQWEEVLRLARYLKTQKALSGQQAARMVHRAHIELLEAVRDDGDALARYWEQIPFEEQRDPWLLTRAVPLLAARQKGTAACRALEASLDDAWDTSLARMYGSCGQTEQEALSCLSRAEKWLERYTDDDGLLYSLGQLGITAQLWGKAQGYLEASLSRRKSVDVYLALARLQEALENREEARRYYQAAALLAR